MMRSGLHVSTHDSIWFIRSLLRDSLVSGNLSMNSALAPIYFADFLNSSARSLGLPAFSPCVKLYRYTE